MTSVNRPSYSLRLHTHKALPLCTLVALLASPAFAKNGGNGNGGGKSKPAAEQHLELHPDVWNLNWAHSAGLVTAFVRGDGVDAIDPATVELVGDAGSALPVDLRFVGSQLQAQFSKLDALGTLGDPQAGDVRTLTLQFSAGGAAGALTDAIRIVGGTGGSGGDADEPEELKLVVKPRKWNTNYDRSRGTVQVFFRGPDVEDIDLSSIQLAGDDPAAEPVEAIVAKLADHHVMARFSKRAVLDALLDPVLPGEERAIAIRFLLDGVATEVKLTILILGP